MRSILRFPGLVGRAVVASRRRAATGLLLGLLLHAGCAALSGGVEVVPPGAPVELGQNEGLLVLDVDSDVPIETILLSTGVIASALPKGKHLWVVRMPAGRNAWVRVDLPHQAGVAARHATRDSVVEREDEFEFSVEPGMINYPGELIVRSHEFLRSSGTVTLRVRNHSAMAIRKLDETHSDLLDRYPLRYAGWSGDGFLEFYSRARRRLGDDSGEASR